MGDGDHAAPQTSSGSHAHLDAPVQRGDLDEVFGLETERRKIVGMQVREIVSDAPQRAFEGLPTVFITWFNRPEQSRCVKPAGAAATSASWEASSCLTVRATSAGA